MNQTGHIALQDKIAHDKVENMWKWSRHILGLYPNIFPENEEKIEQEQINLKNTCCYPVHNH